MASKKKNTTDFSSDRPPKVIGDAFYGLQLDEEQLTFANAIWNPDIDIVFVDAKAGTGKTTIAVGVANLLVHYGFFDELIYIMSPYGERKQGWLPGTITEKSSVYFEALYQALVECNININTAINTDSMVNQKNGTGFVTCITDLVNPLTNAIVIGGLEPFEQTEEVYTLIWMLRNVFDCEDDVVIYTGYTQDGVEEEVERLSEFENIIIKFGRFRPNQTPHRDEVLGINLVSDNQYAVKIS